METWKDVIGYENCYQVSDSGKVRSKNREVSHSSGNGKVVRKGKYLKFSTKSNGYVEVGLRFEGNTRYFMVHRLVAINFIENPLNLPCVNHKDGNKENNFMINLEWVTYKQNMIHARETGLINDYGENSKNSKISDFEFIEITQNKQLTVKELALKYRLSERYVRVIISNKCNRALRILKK